MNTTFKVPGKLNLATLIILSSLSTSVFAEGDVYKFNDGFIMGSHSKTDLTKYTTTGISEGVYSLDVYTNNEWKGRHDITVKKQSNGKMGICYNAEMLEQYGISPEKLNKELSDNTEFCGVLTDWSEDDKITDSLNKGSLRLDITVPQVYQDQSIRNYIDPSFWDDGITALNLGWSGNLWNSHYSQNGGNESTTGYLGLNATATFGGWSLKHRGNLSWENKTGVSWDSTQTYLQKPIPDINSSLSLGQISSSGEFFDSVSIRGLNLRTDDSMFPDGMTSFAPEIRGTAQSNALVTVKQSDNIIYQTTVPPGPFILKDVYPYGYGNNLEVSVKEADGTVNTFVVPYNSGVKLLRPGMKRYEVSIGKPDDEYLHNKPVVYQGTFQYGINNFLTAYTGVNGFDNYQSYLLGAGLNTPVGGISLDVTTSNLKEKSVSTNGKMYRLSFNRGFDEIGTDVSFNMIKYQDEGFYNLADALTVNDSKSTSLGKEKNEYNFYITQQLPDGWGNMYFNGRLTEYWGESRKGSQYQLSYNNSLGDLSYTVSAQRVKTTTTSSSKNDDRVSLNFSYPLNFGEKNRATLTSNVAFTNSKYAGTQMGVNGAVGEDNDINYGVNIRTSKDSNNVSLNSGYRSSWGNLNGSYSQGDGYRQSSVGGNGTIILHDEGVTFSPETGNTLALVRAKGATGGRIPSAPGVKIDSNGFAVISSLRPYRVNNIEVDPKGTSDKIQLNETVKQVVPIEGSIVKVNFDTEVQDNFYIKGITTNGRPLPFGSSIYNSSNEEIGLVGQGGMLFIKNASSPDAHIKWEGGSCKFTVPKDHRSEVTCA